LVQRLERASLLHLPSNDDDESLGDLSDAAVCTRKTAASSAIGSIKEEEGNADKRPPVKSGAARSTRTVLETTPDRSGASSALSSCDEEDQEDLSDEGDIRDLISSPRVGLLTQRLPGAAVDDDPADVDSDLATAEETGDNAGSSDGGETDDEAEEPCIPRTGGRGLSQEEMDYAFPWHLACDHQLRVTSLGSCLAPRFASLVDGTNFLSLVRVVRPQLSNGTFESMAALCGKDALLVVRDSFYHKNELSVVVGELCGLPDSVRGSQSCTTEDSGCQSPTEGSNQSPLPNAGSIHNLHRKPGSKPPPSPAPHGLRLPGWRNKPSDDNFMPPGEGYRTTRRGSVALPVHIEKQKSSLLYLRGEFMMSSDGRGLVFLGVPSVNSVDALGPLGVCLDDFPVHSNGRELLQNAAHQLATIRMAEEITETRAELDQALCELRMEQRKQEMLLHSILPESVAAELSQGVRPKAQKHTNVSVLFSDIVGFTTISSNASPTEIMDMLDSLFSHFDVLCERHGVYKLETIGDAYLVLSGLPTACEDHADRLAAFAVDMVAASRDVLSPLTGKPLEIRVGLHTGSVVAGVAGTTRPRYCVFGDTVNVASRMESTSEAGRIQMSGEFRRELVDATRFTFTSRGAIQIKGKGQLLTFFLDSYTGLPACVEDSVSPQDVMAAPHLVKDNGPAILSLSMAHLEAANPGASLAANEITDVSPPVHNRRISVLSQCSTRSSIGSAEEANYSPIAAAVDCAATVRSAPSEFGDERPMVRGSLGPRSCSAATDLLASGPTLEQRVDALPPRRGSEGRVGARGMLRRSASFLDKAPCVSDSAISRAAEAKATQLLTLPINSSSVIRGQSSSNSSSVTGSAKAAEREPGHFQPQHDHVAPCVSAEILDFDVELWPAPKDRQETQVGAGNGPSPLKLAFAPGHLLLSEVIAELDEASGSRGSVVSNFRLYIDKACDVALPRATSLGELHKAMVGRKQRHGEDRTFPFYWRAVTVSPPPPLASPDSQ
jgi:class 3 adenylate cyclase